MAVIKKEYELKISTADAQASIDDLNKSFQASEDLILDLTQDLNKYNKELDKTTGNSGRAMQKRSALNKKIKETKAAIQEEKTSLKQINSERKKYNKVIDDNTKATRDYSGVVGILDQQTGGLISGTKNLTGSLGGATKGFNAMRVAIIATGIGALVLGVVALGKAFTSSEEGQNKFAKIMTRISVITGNVSDVLARIGKTLMSVGKVIGTVLTGDFKNLGGAIDDLKNNFSEVTEKVKNFGEETKKELELANKIADDRAKADKLERQLILDRAEATRKFNELREKAADKENVSIEDRIAALKEAGRIEDEITQKEIEAARIRFETKKLENSLSDSTKEDLDEEAQLQAKLIELEASRLKKQKTLTAEITTNLREQKAEEKRIRDEAAADKKAKDDQAAKDKKDKEDKELADAKALADLKNSIREAEAVSEDERRELEIVKTTEHYQNLIDLAKKNNLDTTNLESALAEKIKEIRSKGAEETSKNETYWENLTQQQKAQIASQGFQNLATILGEETAAGKAASIAATTISTFQSAQDSYKSLAGIPIVGPALGIAAAGAAIVAGIKTVQKITATPVPKVAGAASSGGSTATPTPTAPPLPNPPSINSIGTGGVNQLAAAIGETETQPVQAFVVANDVTTAQGLERNIIDGASI